MEEIKHTHLEVRGLKLHVAEIGDGPNVVLFLHGFPEIWYTWRYQMIALAKSGGFRAIAFDFRGYGLSDMPSDPEKGTHLDLIDDIVALLDVLGISKVIIIGKDFGAIPASMMAILHPERVSALVTLGVPFMLPGPNAVQLDNMPKGFYMARWKEPGRAEADFGRLDVKTVVKNIYILFSGTEPPAARNEEEEIMDLVDPSAPLPPWFSEEDLSVYASLYEKSGFRFALQVPYRSLQTDHGIKDPKVKAPALLIMGEKDYVINFAGMEDYIRRKVKHFVPELETIFVEEGNHFIHEQLPEKVNELLINFLNKHNV